MRSDTAHVMIWTFFCLCLAYGLFGRWESTRRVREAKPGESVNLSHDEMVLLTLGKNLQSRWSHYHVQEWYEEERKAGRELPAYLGRPLFKHPPLMAMMLAWAGEPGLQGTRNAFLLMFGFGVLVCVVVYGLARSLLSPMWSLVPAAVAWVDPVLWGGSVKVWLALPLTMYCAAGLGFAWRGRSRPVAFLGMGFCFGLAFLTKYPAMAVWAATAILLWKDKSFQKGPLFAWGFALPWLMLAPWLIWNLCASGWSALDFEESRHAFRTLGSHIGAVITLALAGGLLFWMRRGLSNAPAGEENKPQSGRRLFSALFLLVLIGLYFFHSWFSGRLEPRSGLGVNYFSGERAWFYLDRLLSLNPLLWPGLVALFWIRLPAAADFLRWAALVFGLVFSVWGNYQSRYIMPAVPLVCVLSAWSLYQISVYLSKPGAMWLERVWLCSWMVFAVVRLNWIHQKLTLPNQFTYF